MGKNKTPIWAWIGCGCLLCVMLFMAVIGGIGVAGFTFFKGMVEDMADPVARNAKVAELLGAESLPEGFHARAVLGIPFIMQVAILSDGEPLEAISGDDFEEKVQEMENLVLRGDQLGQNTIIYLKLRDRDTDEKVEDILDGSNRGNAKVDLGVRFERETDELISEGEMEVAGQPITWRAFEGDIETQGDASVGVVAAVQVACPSGDVHDVLWFQKSELEQEEAAADGSLPDLDEATARIAGTPGDPEALRSLFEHFRLCRAE